MVKINVTPHTSLLSKIGAASFSVSQSIAELLANSFDALTPDKPARFEVNANLEEISVKDNSMGMTREILEKAIRMAWPMREIRGYGNDKKSEFGLGMKTACASLGNWWSIETITENANTGWHVEFDLEEWSKGNNSWDADLVEIDRSKINLPKGTDSGTLVTIRKLKVKPINEILQTELGRAYAPHIRGKDKIILNGEIINVPEPDLLPGTKQDVDIEVKGVHIKGWGALLKVGSLKDYGFHWYRKRQLIEAFDKSFLPRHPSVRQVTGELNADDMPVNFNKRGFDTESPQWRQAVMELEEIFLPLRKQAQKKLKEQAPDPWTNGQIKDSLELMEQVGESMSVKILNADSPPEDYLYPNIIETFKAKDEIDEEVSEISERHPIVVGSLKIRWRHVFRPMGEDGPIADYTKESESELFIVSNIESPFMDLIKERSVIAVLNVAESISRYLIEEHGFEYSKAVRFRDAWLINVSATLSEVEFK